MAAIAKTNGTTTITGDGGHIATNIAASALRGPNPAGGIELTLTGAGWQQEHTTHSNDLDIDALHRALAAVEIPGSDSAYAAFRDLVNACDPRQPGAGESFARALRRWRTGAQMSQWVHGARAEHYVALQRAAGTITEASTGEVDYEQVIDAIDEHRASEDDVRDAIGQRCAERMRLLEPRLWERYQVLVA